jgi:hypothetical protein
MSICQRANPVGADAKEKPPHGMSASIETSTQMKNRPRNGFELPGMAARFGRLEGWAATTIVILRGSQALAPQDDDIG